MSIRSIVTAAAGLLAGTTGIVLKAPSAEVQRVRPASLWDPAKRQSENRPALITEQKRSDAKPLVILEEIVFRGDKLVFHYRFGDQRWTATSVFKLDPTATPKAIDFTPMEGPNKGKTYLGRYEIDGRRLRICYRGPGSTRPNDFSDKAVGDDATVFIDVRSPPADS
jgi:uncharacterized protein (TIGR03067 family)